MVPMETSTNTQVLLIDDDPALGQLLAEALADEGIELATAQDGQSGLKQASARDFDLALLDIMLPQMSGLEVLRHLRQRSNLPVIMLTARGDDEDRITGLELGADDYLPKPCNPRELAARIRAVLRRSEGGATQAMDILGLRLEPARRTASIQDRTLDLTSTEFSLLLTLARDAGQPVSKEDLSIEVLGRELGPYDRSLDVHISNLRRKLPALPDGRDRIDTVRGVGYQLLA